MAQIVTSKKFSLNLNDFFKGLIVAGITSSVALLEQVINSWVVTESLSFNKVDLILVSKAFVGGALGYLIRNFFQSSKIEIKGEDISKGIKEAGNNPIVGIEVTPPIDNNPPK